MPADRPIRVFRYVFAPSWPVWTWLCSSCGVGHSLPQWATYDTQPAALAAALRHCRESRLA